MNNNDETKKDLLEDKSKEELKEETKEAKNTKPNVSYSIYDYIYKNPTAFITLVSILIALLSFLFNYISFFQIKKDLETWNVDASFLSTNNRSIIYTSVFLFLYIFISCITFNLMANTFDSYKLFFVWNKFYKKKIKALNKNIKRLKSKSKKVSKYNEIAENQELMEIIQSINDDECEVKELRRLLKELKKSDFGRAVPNLIIAAVLNLIMTLILIVFGLDYFLQVSVITIIIFSLVQSVITCVIFYLLMRTDLINYDYEKIEKSGKNFIDENFKKPVFLTEKIRKNGFKYLFSNTSVYFMVVNIVLSLIILIVLVQEGKIKIENNSKFKVATIEDVTYTAVFSNENQMVLEETEIADNIATVHINKQLIVPVENTKFELVEFEKVNRVED